MTLKILFLGGSRAGETFIGLPCDFYAFKAGRNETEFYWNLGVKPPEGFDAVFRLDALTKEQALAQLALKRIASLPGGMNAVTRRTQVNLT